MGVDVSYADSFGIGAKAQYGITDKLRLEGSFDYFLEDDGWKGWEINVDLQYLFPLANNFTVYPFVGLQYSHESYEYGLDYLEEYDIEIEDISEGQIGFALGGGVQYDLSDKLAVFGEIRFNVSSILAFFCPRIGIAYKF